MRWRDSALILGHRKFGETGLILSVLCAEMGRQAGFVPYGGSQKQRPLLEAGNVAIFEWNGRLESHLGRFSVSDVIDTHASHILHRPLALRAIAAVTALLRDCTDEGDRASAGLFDPTTTLIELIKLDDANVHWPTAYAKWEYALLQNLGFALDLDYCALTGVVETLDYISPKTGRGVTKTAAIESGFIDQLLRLPQFLTGHAGEIDAEDVLDALKLTGHFLQIRHFDSVNLALPEPRRALIAAIHARAFETAFEMDGAVSLTRAV